MTGRGAGASFSSAMRARSRVVGDVFVQQTTEPAHAQHDDMIETLSPNGADEPLDVRVLPWRAGRCKHFRIPIACAVTPNPSNA